jgi:hypothetical protein
MLYLGATRENARYTSGLNVRMHAVPRVYGRENACSTAGLHVRMNAVPRDDTCECTLYLGTTRENARCTSGLHVRMHAVPWDYT